ncbi:hypothetical protein TNCV_4335841 [Trichonephila clavipes]|nr:hypothetical protein TNCV_4335841 [Trichonephila clavipes]
MLWFHQLFKDKRLTHRLSMNFLRSTSCGMTGARGHGAIVYCLNSGSGDSRRNRRRDGQVCPDVDKELWRLGPDSSGVFCANRKKEEVKRDFGPANKKERGACCEHTPGV